MDAKPHEDRRLETKEERPHLASFAEAQANPYIQETWEARNGEVAWTYDEIIAREA